MTRAPNDSPADASCSDDARLQAYVELARQMNAQYEGRRSLAWRIHLALWTLLAAAGYLMVSEEKHLGRVALVFVGAVPLHLVWCFKIHIGQIREQNRSIRYRIAAELLASTPTRAGARTIDDSQERSDLPPWVDRLFKSYWWWIVAEVGTTVLITVVVTMLSW